MCRARSEIEQTGNVELELERIVRVPLPVIIAADRVDGSRLGAKALYGTESARRFVDGPVEVGWPDGSVDDVLVEERIIIVVKVEASAHPIRQVDQRVITVEIIAGGQLGLGFALVLGLVARTRTVT